MTGFSVTKCMTTETAHRLIDYEGKCAHIHGHSYRWEVTAQLENKGIMINGISIDFSALKEAMREIIFLPFDHALILAINDPLLLVKEMQNAADGSTQKIVSLPVNPTAEVMAHYVAGELITFLNPPELDEIQEVKILRVRVWETADSYGQWEGEGF